jgi:hypothetical protein
MLGTTSTFKETMTFQVTQIEFDFDDAQESIPEEDKKELYDEILGSFLDADDEDDLIEEITGATGWCINSIDYRHVLN